MTLLVNDNVDIACQAIEKAAMDKAAIEVDEAFASHFEARRRHREVWVKEPALRQIQGTIFVQALLGAFLLSSIFVAIFLAVPAGNLY